METRSIAHQLQNFFQFASQRMETENTALSLEELVQQWRKDMEYSKTLEDVRQGILDEASGLAEPAAIAFSDIRRQPGITD
ncbi:MAG: hypothetical protein RLZZ436_1051 [Planctomycetota bacterium]